MRPVDPPGPTPVPAPAVVAAPPGSRRWTCRHRLRRPLNPVRPRRRAGIARSWGLAFGLGAVFAIAVWSIASRPRPRSRASAAVRPSRRWIFRAAARSRQSPGWRSPQTAPVACRPGDTGPALYPGRSNSSRRSRAPMTTRARLFLTGRVAVGYFAGGELRTAPVSAAPYRLSLVALGGSGPRRPDCLAARTASACSVAAGGGPRASCEPVVNRLSHRWPRSRQRRPRPLHPLGQGHPRARPAPTPGRLAPHR
jgi:hypothetical protein